MTRTRVTVAAAIALLTLGAAATASDTFNFTVNPGAKFNTTVDATAELSGTLRGNWDAASNPAGTKTRSGSDFLFGNCSNPINDSFPFTATGEVPPTSASTSPVGAFTLALDTEALQASLTGLSLDLLNGTAPTFPVDASIVNESTFRTCTPRALWVAATIPIDLGDATLDALTVVQTATPATGILVPDGPNQYTFAAAVEVTVTASLTFNGQSLTSDPTTATLPVAFTVTISGATATAAIDVDATVEQSTTKPIPGPTDLALDIPTIIPPGSTAHFLIGTTLESSTINFVLNGAASANGAKAFSRADWDQNGIVNSTDVGEFINDWFADQVNGTFVADFDGNGIVNSTDVGEFINVWFEEV